MPVQDRDRSLGLRLAAAAALTLAVLVPSALLSIWVIGDWGPLHHLDAGVTDALHSVAEGHAALVRFMLVWSVVFDPNAWRLAALVLVIILFRRGAPRLAWWIVVTMAVGGVLAAGLKLLVGRHRPDLLNPVAQAAGFSFPSGHALNAALGAGVLLLVLLSLIPDRPRLRIALWVAALVLPLITGLCRIGLGVHWTSDVLAGWLMGVAVVAVTAGVFDGWRHRTGRRHATMSREGVDPGARG
ncbi:phosphatase PAP2 family protein [Mangrovihabitans endophyticus]|uniref:Phosphatidic acid phosphatase type 2/haloperoxidase domain-containing protein n=1 Tax=Mangrovihabitans endophyticus TaxID=1751298 RepID=A0A8J3C793_9ACTN|nr:phosphatase PAP2 family protein [Mangrovihabitans endophyticus]GGL15409.1 hypothetical protein GCM10012284_57600 [Mangrovihabitans endophyticus]